MMRLLRTCAENDRASVVLICRRPRSANERVSATPQRPAPARNVPFIGKRTQQRSSDARLAMTYSNSDPNDRPPTNNDHMMINDEHTPHRNCVADMNVYQHSHVGEVSVVCV